MPRSVSISSVPTRPAAVRLLTTRPRTPPDPPPGTETPNGGAALAQVAANEFLVIGQNIRLAFEGAGANAGKPSMYARVEEGHFDSAGKWVMQRNWNGDQTDWGINLTATPTVMKIRLGTY